MEKSKINGACTNVNLMRVFYVGNEWRRVEVHFFFSRGWCFHSSWALHETHRTANVDANKFAFMLILRNTNYQSTSHFKIKIKVLRVIFLRTFTAVACYPLACVIYYFSSGKQAGLPIKFNWYRITPPTHGERRNKTRRVHLQ